MTEFKFNPVKLAAKVLKTSNILCVNFHFFIYKKSGVFQLLNEFEVYKIILDLLEDKYRERFGREIKHCLLTQCYKKPEEVNSNKNLINIKNGMFCLSSMKVFPHAPEHHSTIQLPVEYNEEAVCPKWIKTLDQIFIGKKWKSGLLQEFMGYCLTTDNSHQKALINLGGGANGKSLIFNILVKILGKANLSSVPISKLDERHYLAEMFGKLVNLSIESESNHEINDANFKSIVSGDLITVDEKYGKPFSFNPFCKLIFAMNTLPYVGDKTSAFYRRVLIIPYDKEFSIAEQNLTLAKELEEEIDGIFLWMLDGLKRLNSRGHFSEEKEMVDMLEEYKRDNNPILAFVEDHLVINKSETLSKKDLYKQYHDWSKENGYKLASDKTLTKTIKIKFTNRIKEERSGSSRYWRGLEIVAARELEAKWD